MSIPTMPQLHKNYRLVFGKCQKNTSFLYGFLEKKFTNQKHNTNE